jgi:hypothetical protein
MPALGHLARACPQNKPPAQGGSTSVKPPPPKGSWKTALRKTPGAQRWRQIKTNTAEVQPDLEMKESSEMLTQLEDEAKKEQELLAEGRRKLDALRNSPLNFRIQGTASAQVPSPAAKSNPFAIIGEDNAGAMTLMEMQEDMKEGWSFQGRKRHDPKQTPLRQTTQQLSPHPSHRKITPGGKRGQLHSEVHPSSFASLGIQVPPNKEPLRARIWPVLTKIKKGKKETLVHCRNQSLPNLPLSFKISGPTEAAKTEWTQETARADLIQRLELELEENILRFKWCIKEQLHLEWSWQEEKSRGGMDCTILVHMDTGTSTLSTQNKWHLHWKALDPAQEMNNDIEFATPAHNLLRKTDTGNSARQAHRNNSASLLASPQAARKKRFTKLDLALLTARLPGSIGPSAARNKLTYD